MNKFEYTDIDELSFRNMVIDRVESLIAYNGLTRNQFATLTGISKTSLYNKMDRNQSAVFTSLDFFKIARALNISIVQVFPLTEEEIQREGELPAPASKLKFADDMLKAQVEDVELLHGIFKLYRQHKINTKG